MAASSRAREDTGDDQGDRVQTRVVDYPKSWDNPDLLDRYYNDLDYSTAEIAELVFDGDVSRETIRKRLHEFELMPEDKGRPTSSDPNATRKLLKHMDKDAIGTERPAGDDSYKAYTARERGETDAT